SSGGPRVAERPERAPSPPRLLPCKAPGATKPEGLAGAVVPGEGAALPGSAGRTPTEAAGRRAAGCGSLLTGRGPAPIVPPLQSTVGPSGRGAAGRGKARPGGGPSVRGTRPCDVAMPSG